MDQNERVYFNVGLVTGMAVILLNWLFFTGAQWTADSRFLKTHVCYPIDETEVK